MNIQPVLRPIDTKPGYRMPGDPQPGRFNWVHLDSDGSPLCGEEYDPDRYTLEHEWVDLDDLHAIREFGDSHICRHCAAHYYNYEVECVAAGQARAYADTIDRYKITDLTGERERDEVVRFARTHVEYGYWKEEQPGWYSPTITQCTRFPNGVWVYEVTSAYTG